MHPPEPKEHLLKNLARMALRIIGAIVLLGAALFLWTRTLAKDDGAAGRPSYGAYTWPTPKPTPAALPTARPKTTLAPARCRRRRVAARCHAPTAT